MNKTEQIKLILKKNHFTAYSEMCFCRKIR